ncbi:MAG: hypothetical protein CMB55_03305 [Euryarchaeota archaeon]|nr:hypothetical protein [Euryarchaeota archaeon]
MTKKEDKITRHGLPKGEKRIQQELLYNPDIPTPTHAEYSVTMAHKISTATLCTISQNEGNYPYGSFVTYAIYKGNPIFLISKLAEHTKNLQANSKSSLLIAEGGDENPLALGRITLVGDCEKLPADERPTARSIFLEKHPNARFYVDFEDFDFYCLSVQSIRYIGGFGRMSWVDSKDWFGAEPDPMDPYAEDIIEHMNDDHRDAMVILCQKMSKATDTTDASMVSIDRYGFEMSAVTAQGERPIRLAFDNQASDSEDARKEIITLVKRARASE